MGQISLHMYREIDQQTLLMKDRAVFITTTNLACVAMCL